MVGLLLFFCCTTAPKEPVVPKNVLLIVVDTLRADYLEAYGAPNKIAPNMNKWAKSSVVLTHHFATSSWTRPGFATLLTGKYPSEVGIYEERFDRLAEDIETLPEVLQQKGFSCLAINSNPNIDPYFGFAQGFHTFVEADSRYTWMEGTKEEQEKIGQPLASAEDIAQRTYTEIKKVKEPWFAMTVFIDPHKPYLPKEEDKKAVQNLPQKYHSEYAAEVHHADRGVGSLLSKLEKEGVLEDTLVIITSDHGEGLWSHPGVPHSFEHGNHLYDSVNHVPLIFWHKNLEAKQLDDLTSSISIYPTILDLLGMHDVHDAERPSLKRLIQDGVQKGLPEYVYAQTNWQRNEKFSIRSKDTRYVYSYDAWLFQKEKNVEGKLPLLEETRKLLSGPIHELYTTSCTPLSFCWGDTSLKESWRTNAYSEHQHQSLEKRLQEWNAQVKKRIPEQRAEDDGISVFRIEGENMIEERFVPHEWAEISPEMTPSMREQLKNLGYLDE